MGLTKDKSPHEEGPHTPRKKISNCSTFYIFPKPTSILHPTTVSSNISTNQNEQRHLKRPNDIEQETALSSSSASSHRMSENHKQHSNAAHDIYKLVSFGLIHSSTLPLLYIIDYSEDFARISFTLETTASGRAGEILLVSHFIFGVSKLFSGSSISNTQGSSSSIQFLYLSRSS